MFTKKLFVKIILATSLFYSATSQAQCAMCKAVVENGDEKMAEGINSGIIYLMIFPYLFFTLAAYLLYRRYKKKNNL